MPATTPPISPHNSGLPDPENPLKSTINLLDSLVAHYQHERMWIYRTRAILEDAFPAPSSFHHQNRMPSPPLSESSPLSPSAINQNADNGQSTAGRPSTRWMQRKQGFKLRLDGISPRTRRIISTQQVEGRSVTLEPREQILERFDKMMEARMESCQRVNKLVRNANRANFHRR